MNKNLWTEPEEVIKLESCEMKVNGIYLTIDDQGDERWQYIALSLGKFSQSSFAECKDSWPMEAIRRVRRELDKLEQMLTAKETELEAPIH